MPRGRKSRTISDNNEIQKIKPMFYDLWKKKDNISMAELKILDVYMSAINSHNADTKEVIIDREHLNETLGSHYTAEDLRNLFGKVLELVIRVEENRLISLFSMAEIQKNENSEYQVKLVCSEPAQEYFFNLDKIGYFSYKLKNTLAINSVYSYLMFNYLEMNRFRTTWEVSVEELKQILRCTDECYMKFKVFNDAILKKCYKELNENTSCRFSYETVKHGRYVQAIRFTLEPLNIENPKIPLAEPIPNPIPEEQQTLFEMIENKYADFFEKYFGDDFFETIYRDQISDQMELLKIDSDEKQSDIILKRSIERFKTVISKTKISDVDKYFRKIIETECVKVAKTILDIKQQAEQKQDQPRKEQSYDINEFKKFSVTFSGNTKNKAEEPTEESEKIPDAEPKEKDAAIAEKITNEEVRAFIDNFGKLE